MTASIVERDEAGTVARFDVVDTGPGIHPDKRDAVFEPFCQGDATTTRRFGGTGLGLAITRQLVELMGGRCGVTSELGVGSRFWFTIRLGASARSGHADPRPAGARAPEAVAVAGLPRSPQEASASVLVADDNPVNQKVATAMLRGAGHQVDVVSDGVEAVAAMAARRYAAVLMDCQMPRMDGYAATARIRADEGASRHTPIIAMTASAMESDRQRCLQAGMDDFVAKPVAMAELLAVVARWTGTVEHGRLPERSDVAT